MRFLRLVLVAVPACSDPLSLGVGNTTEHHDITLTDPSPPMQLRVNSCRVDADACPDLCAAVSRANGFGGSVTTCNVTFDSTATYISIDIGAFGGTVVGEP